MADNRMMLDTARPVRLRVVLAVTAAALAAGLLLKLPCADGDWADGRQYRLLCYTDIVPLYGLRGIADGRIPYLQADNEYPVLTGLTMAAAGIPARSHASFFVWNAMLLAAGGLVAAWGLHRMAGRRALLFALAPTLAIHAFTNWDLIAVAAATAGTLAFLRRRDATAGLLLGVGAAAKLYPALLLLPFAWQRLREGRRDGILRLAGWAVVAWGAVNLPFAAASFQRWSLFFRFSGDRPADWDSVWLPVQRAFELSTPTINLLSAATFVAGAAAVAIAAARRRLPPWTFAFPLLVVFLLTSKVYSPQFSLWLVPWFALALPDVRLLAAFSVTEIAVFVTRFRWFADFEGGDLPSPAFQAALLARGLVLIACVVVWLRRPAAAAIEEEARHG